MEVEEKRGGVYIEGEGGVGFMHLERKRAFLAVTCSLPTVQFNLLLVSPLLFIIIIIILIFSQKQGDVAPEF